MNSAFCLSLSTDQVSDLCFAYRQSWIELVQFYRLGPIVATDYGYLKLDGTEDDDDDDEETAQNKLFILVAKAVKTGTSAATGLRENE